MMGNDLLRLVLTAPKAPWVGVISEHSLRLTASFLTAPAQVAEFPQHLHSTHELIEEGGSSTPETKKPVSELNGF